VVLELVDLTAADAQRPSLLQVDRVSVDDLLGQLEHLGYLDRRNDPDDLRSKRVHLTPRGEALRRAIRGR
jgi:DNA-binding MarR family transcriptional regulator